MNIDYQNDIIAKIDYITISEDCMKSFPCQHACTLKLSDGSEKTVTLSEEYIGALITAIPFHKIDCKLPPYHFFKPVEVPGTLQHFHDKIFNLVDK